MPSGPILEIEGVSKRFGGLLAVDQVSLQLGAGTVHTIIGPNGAGKTTLFNVIAGVFQPTSGKIWFDGSDVTGWHSHDAARKGVGRTFQNIRLFKKLSVLDNVLVAWTKDSTSSVLGSLLPLPGPRREQGRFAEEALQSLILVGLAHLGDAVSTSLAHGQQRLLEIARALALRPKVLLLDEPGAGLNHGEKIELVGLIGRLRERGYSVLLIEHNMPLVMAVSDWITVLDHGKLLASGRPADLSRNPEVIRAYLGSEFSDVKA
jgi:branched-chain amino acid transport system ATP-binding protein